MTRAARDGQGAVVLGSDYKALGIVRSLGRHGIPVWVLRDEHSLANWSRYTRRSVAWPSVSEADRVAFLLDLGRNHALDDWALFPTDDETAALLARNRDELSERYLLTVAEWQALRWAYDKRLTYRLASELGIDHPLTRFPHDSDDVRCFDGRYPAILKPAIRADANRFTTSKAWPAGDNASLVARYEAACALVDPRLIMIQEQIPGDGDAQLSYAALCSDGTPIASLVARRTRQWPMDFGRASTYVETIEAPDVERNATRLLDALRFDGIVEIEFKRDARDGRLKLLDINARVWGWHSLGRRAGVDFPYLLWQLVNGERIVALRGRPGVRWVRALTDIPVGQAMAAKTPDGTEIIVARTGDNAAAAFSAICTHQGCAVAPQGADLKCPCHGSVFDALTGAVKNGPAKKPLPSVNVKVQNGQVVTG